MWIKDAIANLPSWWDYFAFGVLAFWCMWFLWAVIDDDGDYPTRDDLF